MEENNIVFGWMNVLYMYFIPNIYNVNEWSKRRQKHDLLWEAWTIFKKMKIDRQTVKEKECGKLCTSNEIKLREKGLLVQFSFF